MNWNRVPVRQWKHREFDGFDPWTANQSVRWSIVIFRMAPESMVQSVVCDEQRIPSESNDIPKKYAVGLYVEKSGRYRILPGDLVAAWRANQVYDQDLPVLLYQREEPVRRKNDHPGPPTGRALLNAILVAVTALVIFGYYIRLLLLPS